MRTHMKIQKSPSKLAADVIRPYAGGMPGEKDPLDALLPFLSCEQAIAVKYKIFNGSGAELVKQVRAMAERVGTMPVSYGQDGKGDETVHYLRYSRAGLEFYVTEKDAEGDGVQGAFGCFVFRGKHSGEYGLINIADLVRDGYQLDFGFVPTTLAGLKDRLAA